MYYFFLLFFPFVVVVLKSHPEIRHLNMVHIFCFVFNALRFHRPNINTLKKSYADCKIYSVESSDI